MEPFKYIKFLSLLEPSISCFSSDIFLKRKTKTIDAKFQTEHFRSHKFYNSISDEYRQILGLFDRDGIIAASSVFHVDPFDSNLCTRYTVVPVGEHCQALLVNEPLQEKETLVRQDVFAFL